MTTLNENEKTVLSLCAKEALKSDNGKEFFFSDIKSEKFNTKQLQGYTSQLVQKGYINILNDCYFDFEIK